MGKIIAVWGCPNSGKTTFCIKLAKAVYDTYSAKILCVFPDTVTPAMPVLFPNKKSEALFSLGKVLSSADVTPEILLNNLVTVKDMRDIGFLGYMDGESRFSYAEYPEAKAVSFLDVAASLVDCGSNLLEPLAGAAISKADKVFQISTPGLRTMSFFASQLPLLGDGKYKPEEHIRVMNICEQALCLPTEETARFLKGVQATVPYAKEVAKQMQDGELLCKTGSRLFDKAMKRLVEMVV